MAGYKSHRNSDVHLDNKYWLKRKHDTLIVLFIEPCYIVDESIRVIVDTMVDHIFTQEYERILNKMDTTSENVSRNSFEDLSSEEYVFKISNIDELTDVDHKNDRSKKETFCSGKNFIDRIKSVKSRLQRIEHKKKIIEERQVN